MASLYLFIITQLVKNFNLSFNLSFNFCSYFPNPDNFFNVLSLNAGLKHILIYMTYCKSSICKSLHTDIVSSTLSSLGIFMCPLFFQNESFSDAQMCYLFCMIS